MYDLCVFTFINIFVFHTHVRMSYVLNSYLLTYLLTIWVVSNYGKKRRSRLPEARRFTQVVIAACVVRRCPWSRSFRSSPTNWSFRTLYVRRSTWRHRDATLWALVWCSRQTFAPPNTPATGYCRASVSYSTPTNYSPAIVTVRFTVRVENWFGNKTEFDSVQSTAHQRIFFRQKTL